MKKSLLLSLFTIGIIGANAQIVITTADIAVPAKQIYQSTDSVTAISPGSTGPSQVWNMSALTTNFVDTLSFIPYSWNPNPSFAGSNLVLQQGTQNIHAYLVNSASMLTVLGNYATFNIGGSMVTLKQVNSPAEKIATFPYSYTSNFTNNYTVYTAPFSSGSLIPGVDSMRMKSDVRKTVLVDAWGLLTTPLGTYSVIRAKETKVAHDTTDVHVPFFGWQNGAQTTADSTTSYTFWANSVGFPLVTVNMDSVGVADVQWLQALPVTVGINESTAPVLVSVFPNPAQNEINIAIDASIVSAVQIYDVMGKLAGTFPISLNVTNVNTSAFANGSYTFSVIGNDQTVLTRGKFIIAK